MKHPKNSANGQAAPVRPDQRSLSEHVVFLRQELQPKWTNETVPQLYDTLFGSVFGKPPRRHSTEDDARLGVMRSLCERYDVDPDMFILANMMELREWIAGQRRLTFQTAMLTTTKARERYNRFLQRMNWRYRNGLAEVVGSMQWLGAFRKEITGDEERIAELYLRTNLTGEELDWDEAREIAEPGRLWREFQRGHGMNVCAVKDLYGQDRPAEERELATLSAAWAVCQKLRHRLPDLIGFTSFEWPELLSLLRVVLQPKQRRPRLSRRDRNAIKATGALVWEPGLA